MTTPNLGLPELTQNQEQPHVPVNTSLRRLDVAAQLSAISASTTAPPGSPAAGDVYLVPASGASGAWAPHANKVAFYNSGWQFLTPKTGWLAYVADEGERYQYIGDSSPSGWEPYIPGTGGGGGGIDVSDGGSPAVEVAAQGIRFVGATVTETSPGQVDVEFEVPALGVPGGAASLDGGGQVPISQLPATIVGAVDYQGTWNASTNTPNLGASSPTKGDYFVVSVAGATSLGGITDWAVGDWAIYNGAAWQKVDNSETPIPVDYQVALSDNVTPISSGVGVAYMRAPRAFTLTGVRASLAGESSSGAVQVDVNVNGSTILSTKLTIDANERTSVNAATPPVISSPNIADDDEITFDIDSAGTGATGLVVTLRGTL